LSSLVLFGARWRWHPDPIGACVRKGTCFNWVHHGPPSYNDGEMSGGIGVAGLLEGLRVLDLSLWQPGHVATQLLADLGADVLKIEPPGGDRMRPQPDRFVNFNGRKRSLVLNLKVDADRGRLLELLPDSEVVVENYRPGVADRLGVGFESLRAVNPAIVLCSITGFGQIGPLATARGFDPHFQAYAGAFTEIDGGEPVRPAILVGDQGGGLAAAFAILAAVLCARGTGGGEHIDISITDLLASWVAPNGYVDERREATVSGADDLPAIATFRTGDGRWVVVSTSNDDRVWDQLCGGLGLEDYVGLTVAERTHRSHELRPALVEGFGRWRRDEIVEQLAARGVPVAPVLSRAEMFDHPHFRERGVITIGYDGMRALGHPIRYVHHPAMAPGRPPDLDEH
jgi:crotonobetainyl-CoA:carnitine CoA-transferase CaiB-like acyl-CoA transferase